MTTLTIADLYGALEKDSKGLPANFNPEDNLPSEVKPVRKAAHLAVRTLRTAQAVGSLGARQAMANGDLTEDAKARLRQEQIGEARKAISAARAELSEAWATFETGIQEAAERALAPPSFLPRWPSGYLADSDRAELEHVRAGVKASEAVAQQLAADRAERMIDRALAADVERSGASLLAVYQTARAAGDPMLLAAFEHLAPLRLGFEGSEAQREAIGEAIRSGRLERIPEPIQRLAAYGRLLSAVPTALEAFEGEAASEAFWSAEGGGGGLKIGALPQILGPEVAKFIGAVPEDQS